jgi:hypothetical protein
MFALAYMGRKRRGAAPSNAPATRAKRTLATHGVKAFEKIFSAHVRWCEHGAPVDLGLETKIRQC